MESASRNIKLPTKGTGRRMAVLTFQTTDAMSAIGPWYETRLTKQGWVGGVTPTDSNAYQFKKGGTVISLNEKPSPSGPSILTMSIVDGIPPGSGSMPTSPP
jgi:hypothetical protein